MIAIVKKYLKWKQDNPDKDYQYDEINEFFAELSRGEKSYLMDTLLEIHQDNLK